MPSPTKVTPLGLAVLELLQGGPMHPYEMHQTMRTRHTDRIVKLKAGSLYHTVERLERLELVEVAETSRTGRRPERTVYAITDAGRRAFAAHVADMLAAPAEEFPAYALAVGLAPALDRETVVSELTRRTEELGKLVDAERAATEHLVRMELPERYWLDVRYSLAMHESELAWTTDLLDRIRSRRLDWPSPPATAPPSTDSSDTTDPSPDPRTDRSAATPPWRESPR